MVEDDGGQRSDTHPSRLPGATARLTCAEFSLLEAFVTHPDRVLTRTELFEHVWGFEPAGSYNFDVYVGFLRRKLELGSSPRAMPRSTTCRMTAWRVSASRRRRAAHQAGGPAEQGNEAASVRVAGRWDGGHRSCARRWYAPWASRSSTWWPRMPAG
ncbi:winged helix-turn-helix domain-containing protein [Actinoplanes sp. URMC 104]|uniref:winged helix-turn-helix domain-containing protein n=1 Tax=Actinoplanes sp. URMC 104 TaxID=3423409 RepID=UPI003F1A0147